MWKKAGVRKEAQINVRCTETQRREIVRFAQELDMSVTDLIFWMLYEVKVTSPRCRELQQNEKERAEISRNHIEYKSSKEVMGMLFEQVSIVEQFTQNMRRIRQNGAIPYVYDEIISQTIHQVKTFPRKVQREIIKQLRKVLAKELPVKCTFFDEKVAEIFPSIPEIRRRANETIVQVTQEIQERNEFYLPDE